ncbi:MAG: dipeptide ABC transporter ATP-binding protein [Planctomycetes bacterium]|nr:dipeptide ABC transporter ATP-binding protein [Planctomycetota bacterium]
MTAVQSDPARPGVAGKEPLLVVENLKTYFPVRRGLFGGTIGYVKAVDGVSFSIGEGRTLGLVGESGCGKTTTGRTILRLIPATDGSVSLAGQDIFALSESELRRMRRHMQIIFQDPYGSLNPRMTVGSIVGEALTVHRLAAGSERQEIVAELLRRVGLTPDYMNRYPHEFSGGQRQRIGIARALALSPRLIVCDEPVSALDVSIQAQILNLLEDLQAELQLTYLFIAHDLSVVAHIADEVAVMYLGRIVEKAPSDTLYGHARHPYTWCLMSAIPLPDPKQRQQFLDMREGEPPSPVNPPSGCPFHPRCPKAFDRCSAVTPTLTPVDGKADHVVACHLYE